MGVVVAHTKITTEVSKILEGQSEVVVQEPPCSAGAKAEDSQHQALNITLRQTCLRISELQASRLMES